MAIGVKYDDSKLRWTLLPLRAVKEVVKVLEFGVEKYSKDNWQKVDKQRYIDAAFRHLTDYVQGEKIDKESGFSHLAHCVCCLLFVMWFDGES